MPKTGPTIDEIEKLADVFEQAYHNRLRLTSRTWLNAMKKHLLKRDALVAGITAVLKTRDRDPSGSGD